MHTKESLAELIAREGNEHQEIYQGLQIYMHRPFPDESAHWCGYVGIPLTHPLAQIDACGRSPLDEEMYDVITAHGGISFSSTWDQFTNLWFFGFDCAHSGDYAFYEKAQPGYYRDKAYVLNECHALADQLIEYERTFITKRLMQVERILADLLNNPQIKSALRFHIFGATAAIHEALK